MTGKFGVAQLKSLSGPRATRFPSPPWAALVVGFVPIAPPNLWPNQAQSLDMACLPWIVDNACVRINAILQGYSEVMAERMGVRLKMTASKGSN